VRAYAKTRHSSSGSRRFSFIAWRTLLGLCIGARYAMLKCPNPVEDVSVECSWKSGE
jgi:hypothetical protein